MKSLFHRYVESPEFNYELAKTLLNLSAEAYNDEDKFDLSGENIEKLYCFSDTKLESMAYLTYSSVFNCLMVGFRGTSNPNSLIRDIVAIKETYPKGKYPALFTPKVHKGALQAYLALRDEVFSKIKVELKSRNINTLYVTGHSLGGALATICAYDCQSEFPDVEVGMYNFGSIRTGNLPFAMKYNKLVPNTYRIVNNEDFGARFPKLLYKHVGKLVFISNRKLRINPSRFFQFLENLDNPIGIATGQAVFDHLVHKYKVVMDNLVEYKPGKEYRKIDDVKKD